MHEYSIVEGLIKVVLNEIKAKGVTQVTEVHVRRGSTFAEAPLRQAFQILSENTPLKSAELIVEEYSVSHTCENCSLTQVVNADDLIGHLYICPQCGAVKEIEEAHGLVLVGIKY